MMQMNERSEAIRRAQRALKALGEHPRSSKKELGHAREHLNACYSHSSGEYVWDAVAQVEAMAERRYGVPGAEEQRQLVEASEDLEEPATAARGRAAEDRALTKWKIRETVEVIVGAVTGSLQRPEVLVAGRYRGDDLMMVGRTVPLTGRQATELARLLKPAGPEHPWPDQIGSGRWGGGLGHKIPLVKVHPEVVVEVAADLAVQAGQWRHPLRLLQYRADLTPGDVDTVDTAAM